MGVATDKSLQGLTTAVTNISATGMSDSTGQAINTTLGTLGKDTTLHDIKTAINNLSGAISPAAANVTFDNTGTGMTASNVQAAIDEVDALLDELNATSTSISRYTGVSTSVPLPAVSRRGKIVIIHFAHLLPAGTYLNIWNVSPTPASQQHAIVSLGSDMRIITVLNTGVVKFNNSITINNDSYVIGQIVYNTN